MAIFDHPGNLGATRGTLLTIHHADWPAYPEGDDFYAPLLQLTAFPPETQFVVVDDIDKSLLLVADLDGDGKVDDPLNEQHFHIAVWHEDLRSLYEQGMLGGVRPASEREWVREYWKSMKERLSEGGRIGYMDEKGEFVEISEPDYSEYDDEFTDCVVSAQKRLHITELGRKGLLTKLREAYPELRNDMDERLVRLLDLGYYDTAIREACVQLESGIKAYLQSSSWGNRLAEEFVAKMRDEKKLLESQVRTFRQELRTIFKFIRNEFAHNLKSMDEAATQAVLFRVVRATSMLSVVSVKNDHTV